MAAKGRGSAVRAPPPSTSRGKKVTGRAAPIAAEKKAAPAKVSKLELDIEPCTRSSFYKRHFLRLVE